MSPVKAIASSERRSPLPIALGASRSSVRTLSESRSTSPESVQRSQETLGSVQELVRSSQESLGSTDLALGPGQKAQDDSWEALLGRSMGLGSTGHGFRPRGALGGALEN
jgi:hypothetical protein